MRMQSIRARRRPLYFWEVGGMLGVICEIALVAVVIFAPPDWQLGNGFAIAAVCATPIVLAYMVKEIQAVFRWRRKS